MPNLPRKGLYWHQGSLDLQPRWEYEPSLEAVKAVCLQTLGITQGTPDYCTVSFLASGGFNKLYLVETTKQNQKKKCVMRVSLPVDPHHKTIGEVTTLRWLRRHTTIPVPGVIGFDSSSDNKIGFEWIMMDFMPGVSAWYMWRKMSMAAKRTLVERLADYQVQLCKSSRPSHGSSGFSGIGTLKDASENEITGTGNLAVAPGRNVSPIFFWGPHYDYDVPRGPFRSSHDWLHSYIQLIIEEQSTIAKESDNEEYREDATEHLQTANKLLDLLPKLFPSASESPPEPTILWHSDLSLSNILVDDQGAITAIVDWECSATMPHWVTVQTPTCLSSNLQRDEMPNRDTYANEDPNDATAQSSSIISSGGGGDGDASSATTTHPILDNEGKNELYWIHLMEYEMTQLKTVYANRMRLLSSTWDKDVADTNCKADFLTAVNYCAAGFFLKGIGRWIDALNEGELPRLYSILSA